MPPESARAVARARPVNFAGIRSVFYWLKSGKKNILIIYAPRECPSGSEGQTCGEMAGFRSGFYRLKSGKKMY